MSTLQTPTKKHNLTRSWLVKLPQQFISGIAAGVANVLICAPLDTARTRQQLQGLSKAYSGILRSLITIYKEEGFKGWYHGMNVTLISYPLNWSIYFPLYHSIRKQYKEDLGEFNANVLGASAAGALSGLVTNPLWLIGVRLQAQSNIHRSKYSTVLGSLKTIIQEEGVQTLFQGYSASLLGLVHVMVQFPLYELMKKYMADEHKSPTLMQMLACSFVPKTAASLVSYPHELLRTRMFHRNRLYEKRFTSLRELIQFSYRTEGLKGFYAGFTTNLARILPSTFITLYIYEAVSHLLKRISYGL